MIKLFILGFVVISMVGTLLHFTYDFSKHNKVIAIFSAVNESVWEHIKMTLTATLLWSLVDGYIYGMMSNYFIAKLIGLLTIIIIMPTIFYGYQAFAKKPILFIDIASFFVTVFLSQYFTYLVLNAPAVSYYVNYIAIIGLFIIFGFYMVLTISPIKGFLFKDPITKEYGLKGHK